MPQPWPAADIARMILEGFDDYREHFRCITDGARSRFEQAQWQQTQSASAARINLYEDKVSEVSQRLHQAFTDEVLLGSTPSVPAGPPPAGSVFPARASTS